MDLPLSQINFGAADAAHEVEDDENLLLEGYFDIHNAVEECLEHPHYLVMGYKGSGKTALGQHLLLSGERRGLAVRTINLRLLQLSDFPGLLRFSEDWQATYPAIWSFHLLIQVIDAMQVQLKRDGNQGSGRFSNLVSQLQAVGALPAEDLPQAIRAFNRRADALEAIPGRNESGSLEALNAELVAAIGSVGSSRRPILVVDGLDEYLHPTTQDLFVLTSLIEAVGAVNRNLRNGSDAVTKAPKVIVLCRTDLFDRLPGANTAKVREDRTVHLHWFQNTADPEDTFLARLLNTKARVSDPGIESVSKKFFPRSMNNKPLLTYFLDHTRHTPRDFLRVFRHVQGFSVDGRTMDYGSINQGLRSYSTYFDAEIRNEMSGYASEEEIAASFQLLRSMGKVQFSLSDLEVARDAHGVDVDPRALLTRLFECSALGLVERHVKFGGRSPRYTFKYRNPNASVNLEAEFRVHVGWRRHLSVATARAEEEGLRLEPAVTGQRRRKRTRRPVSDGLQPELPFGTGESQVGRSEEAPEQPKRGRRRSSRPQGPPSPAV